MKLLDSIVSKTPDSTLRVYLYLATVSEKFTTDDGRMYVKPSLRKMAKDLSKIPSTCIRIVRSLEEMKWIQVERAPNRTTLYTIGDRVDGKVRYLIEDIAPSIAIET